MRGLDLGDCILVLLIILGVSHIHHTEKHIEAVDAQIAAELHSCAIEGRQVTR